jgi:hypothetical protein
VRRFCNDSIYKVAEGLDDPGGASFDFLCECGDLRCRQYVQLTLAEYREREPGSVTAHD